MNEKDTDNSEVKECYWKNEEDTDNWDTSCDNRWTMLADSPWANGMHFCPYCGKVLIEKFDKEPPLKPNPEEEVQPTSCACDDVSQGETEGKELLDKLVACKTECGRLRRELTKALNKIYEIEGKELTCSRCGDTYLIEKEAPTQESKDKFLKYLKDNYSNTEAPTEKEQTTKELHCPAHQFEKDRDWENCKRCGLRKKCPNQEGK